jgi:hypothetical protein
MIERRDWRSKSLARKLGKQLAGHDMQTVLDAVLLVLSFIAAEQQGDKRDHFFCYLRQCLAVIEADREPRAAPRG